MLDIKTIVIGWRNSQSLGLKLVNLTVENQLKGSIDMENREGASFTITFPMDETQE